MIPTNESAFRRKTHPDPAAATNNPPSAGPTARATLKPTPDNASADGSSLAGTNSGTIACHAGLFIAEPRPSVARRRCGVHCDKHPHLCNKQETTSVKDVGQRARWQGKQNRRQTACRFNQCYEETLSEKPSTMTHRRPASTNRGWTRPSQPKARGRLVRAVDSKPTERLQPLSSAEQSWLDHDS